ncbi:glycoside hydrolase family 19 protein [Pinisolibacter aquiterrae]|uniref:glycoside hydrolase family 19 protein n=1 Tax=Pinisolibacter aquiterrae TaxID=2815579 RepID=UPI001C3E66B1|nr:glycoside hydrolase family 19 protein [Pinisolibacter aquiterrae]MBV5263974.1 glycoside hydrolase family 19 protein [Pinisolibacter aquiterrae]MCC8233931.1 glycoside hydrolase family 19 protein [Pinisolibacter aquiterrae]
MSIVSISRSLIRALAPDARSVYLAAFDGADADLAPSGINAGRRRVAHFLAQVCHETDGLTIRVENMNYSAARLPQVWPSRFKDPAVARAYAHDPEKLANFVYADRMGNGPAASGDGWAFIGRGLLQITGREAYETYGRALGIDLAGHPDLAYSAEWSLKIAAAEWAASSRRGRSCNEMADDDDVEGVTRAINGGLIGFSSRKEWLRKVERLLGV